MLFGRHDYRAGRASIPVPSVRPASRLMADWVSIVGWKTSCRRPYGSMEKSHSRMLEVSVSHHPPRWEWEVTSNGEPIANGFERGEIEDRFEGHNALFLLLAAG